MARSVQQDERLSFVEAVREIADFLHARGDTGQEVTRRHFRFESDKYYIESHVRLRFDGGIHDAFFRKPEELDLELPALDRCLKMLAPHFAKAHADLDQESRVDFGYWQAWIRLKGWIGQCFSSAGSNNPCDQVAGAVFDERYALLQGSRESTLGTFIVPVHGVAWACEQETVQVSDGLSLVHLTDEMKSEGWYDHWFDFVSTNPRDIAHCEVAVVGMTKAARGGLNLLLDCMRLAGFRRIKAPDCFWLGHEFSVSPAGLGPVDNYDSISRPMLEEVALASDDVHTVAALLAKVQRIRTARNDGPLETPIRRYVLACNRSQEADRLMDLALSMETLFSTNDSWLQSLAVLAPYLDVDEAAAVKDVLIRLKRARNTIAHTGEFEPDRQHANFNNDAFSAVSDVICACIAQVADSNSPVKEVTKRCVDNLIGNGLSAVSGGVSPKWWRIKPA